MSDEFQIRFPWVSEWIERPLSQLFDPVSTEHAILIRFSEGWGTRDTVELLRELTMEYDRAAGRTVEKWVKQNIIQDWTEIGKWEAHEGSEIEELIRVLWDRMRDDDEFEFAESRDEDGVSFYTTQCPIYDLAERTGMYDWLYHLACSTDIHVPGAFSSRIRFRRTKTLMRGNECCNHRYYYRTGS